MKAARILVVDDEVPSQDIITRVLRHKGHHVVCAGSAEEALALLGREPFDVVFLDHVLPGITGLQALRELKSAAKAPIFLMSGYVDADFQKDALLLGAKGFLPKPLDYQALEAAITALPEVNSGPGP